MKEKTKKQISVLYSVLLIILAAAFAVVTVLPVVTFDAEEVRYGDEYYTGSFTTNMDKPSEIKFGLISVIDFIRHFGDAQTIARVQAGNKTVDEAERERLEEKLDDDESFANTVVLFYAFGGLVEDDSDSSSGELDTGKLGTGTLRVTLSILKVSFLISLIGVGLVFHIIVIIKFIGFLIRSLKSIKESDAAETDKRMDKFPFTSYTATMLMLYMLYALVAAGVGMGAAILGAVIVFLLVCLLRAVKTALFAEKDKILMLVKQGITLVSIIAVAALLVNFVGVGLVTEYDDAIVDMSSKQYFAELDDLADSDMDDYKITETAQKAVSTSNGINTAIFVSLTLLGAIFMVAALGNSVERFANKKGKTKTGELVPYKAMVVLSVILLVVAIVPAFVGVDSKEARDEGFEKGQLKIWYTEYKAEGTPANIEYELLKEFKEAGDEELAELREELKSADDEKAEEIKEDIEDGKKMLAEADDKIQEIEARSKRPVNCIIAGIVFLLAEYAYFFVPKYLSKGKKEEEPAEEPVAESEEAPVAE